MTVTELLKITEHRPWVLPQEKWKFYQEWNKVIFLHWQVAFSDLERFIPNGLEIDLFEGKPWVSLVAFTMESIRPRYLPPFSPISDFHEINIRTYVKRNHKAGVYFLSIEGGTKISCMIARALSGLPYRYSTMKRKESFYSSENKLNGDKLQLDYQAGLKSDDKSELDKWLTERYALFQDAGNTISEFEIHHIEWPLYEIEFNEIEIKYPGFSKLLNKAPDRKNYSTGVQVLAWSKK